MRLFTRRRGKETSTPLATLVRDLEDLSDDDTRASMWSYDVKLGGKAAAERCLAQLAPEFRTGYVSPMCEAFAKYERSTSGVDLTKAPEEFTQDRHAEDAAADRLARTRQRLAERMNWTAERVRTVQLAAIRTEAEGNRNA